MATDIIAAVPVAGSSRITDALTLLSVPPDATIWIVLEQQVFDFDSQSTIDIKTNCFSHPVCAQQSRNTTRQLLRWVNEGAGVYWTHGYYLQKCYVCGQQIRP